MSGVGRRLQNLFISLNLSCVEDVDTTSPGVSAVGLIQVTDNGRGIHPMDRTLLGVHYCTSKIRTFQDVVTWDGVLSASVARHWPVLPKSVER